jgi:hypothetical protein
MELELFRSPLLTKLSVPICKTFESEAPVFLLFASFVGHDRRYPRRKQRYAFVNFIGRQKGMYPCLNNMGNFIRLPVSVR